MTKKKSIPSQDFCKVCGRGIRRHEAHRDTFGNPYCFDHRPSKEERDASPTVAEQRETYAKGESITKATPGKISSNPIPLAGFEQIPYESIVAVCKIIKEGEAAHGLDNWKGAAGHPSVINERLAHVINHAMLYISGDRNEDHLAKVVWGGIFMREAARMTGDHQDSE